MQRFHENHIFIPSPQAMKIPDAKAAVDKEWKKLEAISAWQLNKVKSEKEVIKEAQKRLEKKSTFLHRWTFANSINAELEPKYQKYKGRVVLSDDIVKDDTRSYAVFKDQGSLAPQLTAAKVFDVIAKIPDCDGQAADAVSAYTR